MEARNEHLPRQSDIKHFLDEEEFDSIPDETLAEASLKGVEKHDIIHKNYGKPTNNIISLMFAEGLTKIFNPDELKLMPIFEKQLNGARFTGKPDFRLIRTIIDYKFSIELRPTTALQLVMYKMLIEEVLNIPPIERLFAFHYPKDRGLFIHKVPDRAIEPLLEYADYIIENHQAISDGEIIRYEAISKWETLLQDYEVFEPVAQVLPPLTITNKEEAIAAAVIYYNIKAVTDHEDRLKRELKRYMEESGDTTIGDVFGYGVKLINSTQKLYDKNKKAAAKKVYDKALEDCKTGTLSTYSLRRFKPTVKKAKLIN
jgi:hypothetical protein